MATIKKAELMKMLGTFVRVENGVSRNGCGKAPNQFIIEHENGEVFQSYSTLIGARIKGKYYFTNYHDCSNTTSSHCGLWCGCNAKERRKGLAEGYFTLIED